MKKSLLILILMVLGLGSILQSQTIVTGYSENFDHKFGPVDSAFWAPNSSIFGHDTLAFTVMQDAVTVTDSALHIFERQLNFFDGQMYDFLGAKNLVLDLTDNPFISFKVKIDSADWKIPTWPGGVMTMVPSTTVPFSVSPFLGDTRLGQYVYDVPIDGQWHTYYFTFVTDPASTLTNIDKLLIESVSWPAANKAYYWMDDFKAGVDATPPSQATAFTVGGKDGVDAITTKGATLQMVATFDPVDATVQDVIWKVLAGSGYGKIDASGLLTPVSDGELKVVGITKDGSGLTDTVVITLSNQILVKKGYSQNFNSADNFDINFWQPNTEVFGHDTLKFAVSLESNALHVLERQGAFFDGQMYNFKKWAGFVLDVTDNPFAQVDIKIDSADWQIPTWPGGVMTMVPSTTVPFQLSCFVNGTRNDAYSHDVPIDGQWHTYYYSFFNPTQDFTAIDEMLLESVSWPAANKVYFWMDNFKVGNFVSFPYPVETITVSNTMGLDSITVAQGTLTLKATVMPDTATIKDVYWTISDTLIALVGQDGKVKAKDVNGDVIVTATAKDGSGVTGTYDVHISVATGIHTNTVSQFKLYPNPANDFLRINGAERISNIAITTITGQVVLKGNLNGARNEINISGLSKGIYMVRIVDKDGNTFVRNFVKQ